jgi:hypothetical protein
MKGRKKYTAHDVAACLSRELTGAGGARLGKYFWGISEAGITVRCNLGVQEVSRNRGLNGRANRIRRQIIKMRPALEAAPLTPPLNRLPVAIFNPTNHKG